MNETELKIAVARAMSPAGQVDGALSALCFAGAFVCEPETWPVFMAWVDKTSPSLRDVADAAGVPWESFSPGVMAESVRIVDSLIGDPDD